MTNLDADLEPMTEDELEFQLLIDAWADDEYPYEMPNESEGWW